MPRLPLPAVAWFAASLSAQAYIDRFDYPDGPVIPGWTQQRGTWQVQNGRVAATSGALWAYLTKDGLAARTCVLDLTLHALVPNLYFAGLAARHPGGDVDTGLLMVKLQNNGDPPVGFDRAYEYERGVALGSYFTDLPPDIQRTSCRMVTCDAEFWLEVDSDSNGFYELALAPRPITQVHAAGLVGVNGYGMTRILGTRTIVQAELDDFEYFDAVLTPTPQSLPRIGTTYSLRLDTPSAGVPWIAFMSFGNAGIPLDGSRAIPLTLDGMLTASLGAAPALGLVGTTDSRGSATPALAIPYNTHLVRTILFMSAITIDTAKPFYIGHISNEQQFQIRG